MTFSEFKEIFDKLSEENQFIIFTTLQMMEHKKDNDNDIIDIKRGIDIAKAECDLTDDEICNNINKKFNCKDGNTIKDTYKSLIRRNSRRSDLYQHIFDELCINESFIEEYSDYYQSRIGNFQWLYDSLLPKDKNAISCLVTLLSDIDSVRSFLDMINNSEKLYNNIGLETIY